MIPALRALVEQLNDYAARLDRLCDSAEKGASWESAAHLRNRVTYALRSLARDCQKQSNELEAALLAAEPREVCRTCQGSGFVAYWDGSAYAGEGCPDCDLVGRIRTAPWWRLHQLKLEITDVHHDLLFYAKHVEDSRTMTPWEAGLVALLKRAAWALLLAPDAGSGLPRPSAPPQEESK